MPHYIIQINKFGIKEGKLDVFKASVLEAQKFAEANDPLLLAELYIDDASMEAVACLIHRDSESILAHWDVSERHMTEMMEFCDPKRVEILGKASDAVMERLRQYEKRGVVVTMIPHFAGFSRF